VLNYFYCENPYRSAPGGSVGYLSQLRDGMESLGEFRSASGIRHAFLFPPQAAPYRPIPTIKGRHWYPYIENYQAYTDDKKFIHHEMERHFFSVIPDQQSTRIQLAKITSIHAHGPYCFLPVDNFLRICGLDGEIIKILTPHNPVRTALEEIEFVQREIPPENMKDFILLHKYRDKMAFRRADALIFPCEESLDGYYATWPGFKDIIKDKPVYYAATGVAEKHAVVPGNLLRRQLGIPLEAKVILFIGRFMKVRGFELFAEAARLLLANGKRDVYFLSVGKINGAPNLLDSPFWLEHEFASNPMDFITMADACVAVGKYHFFDISMLESLSSGTPYIASDAGGNRYLKGKTRGVFHFTPGSAESLAAALLAFLKTPARVIQEMRQENRALYLKEFTAEKFAQRYLDVYDHIYADFGVRRTPGRTLAKIPYLPGITPTLME
jgi:glycosyltransferase involved in cell wall biosynthesis